MSEKRQNAIHKKQLYVDVSSGAETWKCPIFKNTDFCLYENCKFWRKDNTCRYPEA